MITREQFVDIFNNQVRLSEDVLVDKARQYAGDSDALHNFRTAAVLEQCTMRQALAGMMAKHTVSIYDLCAAEDSAPLDTWYEKLTDHINYLILLRAVVEEEADTIARLDALQGTLDLEGMED